MAGRGRSMTMPAWMTESSNGSVMQPESQSHQQSSNGQYDDAVPRDRSSRTERRHTSRSKSPSHRSSRRDRSRSRDSGRNRSRDRSSNRRDRDDYRSSHRSSNRRDSSRSPSPDTAPSKWVSRRKGKPSNFDVRPPDGAPLPPIGGIGSNSILGALGPDGHMHSGMAAGGLNMQQTRHARRLYVGGIPVTATDNDIANYFRDVLARALDPSDSDGRDPVVSVYMNREKCFAFVELTSIELTSACCQLDGLQFKGNSLRIRRPNDFIPAQMPRDLKPTPVLNLGALGVISTTVTDGPNKVFVGGLPYDLGEEDIKELLMAFGPLKSFHLPKEPSSNLSKGYAFCEYQDPANTNIACEGLNNLPLRDKVLTVRVATQHTTDVLPSHLSASALASIYGPAGVGMAAQGPLSIANTAYAAPDISSEPPTRVLVLKNMVEPHELQDDTELADIREDVTEECSQHGTVRQVMLPRVKDGFPVSAEGSIFVEFETPQMARTAAMALRGRKFADKMVALSYFDEIRFANRELA